jgi:Tfp pilus assembly protein FimT
MKRHQARRLAFTLFEVLLVLALLVIVAALALPSVEAMYADHKVQAAADLLRSAWADARTRAMEEGQAYRFAVVLGKGNFRIAPDSADHWSGGDASPAGSAGAALVVSTALPKGISFRGQDQGRNDRDKETVLPADRIDPSQWSPLIAFLPDGTAREDVSVTLEMSGARPLVVTLRGLTGGVKVRPVNGGAKR